MGKEWIIKTIKKWNLVTCDTDEPREHRYVKNER